MAAPKDGGRAAAGAAGGRRPRPEKDGGGGAAPPARPQWRSFPGLGGPAARAGRGGARSGQRTARRLVVLGPRPPARLPARPAAGGAKRALVGRAELAPGPAERPAAAAAPPAFLQRAPLAPTPPPPPAPDPAPLPGGAFRRGRERPGPLLPRTARGGPRPRPRSSSRGGTWAARRAGVCGLGGGGGPVTGPRPGPRSSAARRGQRPRMLGDNCQPLTFPEVCLSLSPQISWLARALNKIECS